jgi:hypothetical protein
MSSSVLDKDVAIISGERRRLSLDNCVSTLSVRNAITKSSDVLEKATFHRASRYRLAP